MVMGADSSRVIGETIVNAADLSRNTSPTTQAPLSTPTTIRSIVDKHLGYDWDHYY